MLLRYAKTATLVSQCSPQEIERLLLEETRPVKWYDLSAHQDFKGLVYADGFRIRRTGKNALRIRGKVVVNQAAGSHIELAFTSDHSDTIAQVLSIGLGILLFLIIIMPGDEGRSADIGEALFLCTLPAIFVLLVSKGSYYISYCIAVVKLEQLLKARETSK